jgi:RNA polymerase sigma-70 factor (ECF subfamily)
MITDYATVEIAMEKEKKLFANDLDLIAQAQAGDKDAFVRLYRQHIGHIYATCLRMLADGLRAEEMAQETIARAWKMLSSFRGESPFGGWIHRIAVNAVLDHIRNEQKLSVKIMFTGDIEEYDAEEEHISPEESLDLEEAISSLPKQARAILILHDIEGYRHREIAKMLDIAPGTSKAQLHRARLLVKERLQR